MYKININNEVDKYGKSTKYGLLTINNIEICPELLEQYVSKILISKDKLEFVFADTINDKTKYIRMLNRFLPVQVEKDIEEYIMNEMGKNSNFYSFFAEALLAVAYNDIYGYQLSSAVLDINDTVVDSHTGVDACMYDKKNDVLVLGEAKFYQSLSAGINKIVKDLTDAKGFLNKLSSFKLRSQNNDDSACILLKQLNKDKMDIITLEEFLSLHIIYSGFVLHEHNGKIEDYKNKSFYDKYNLTVQSIEKNIKNILKKDIPINHEIIMFHLPIKNKKELIKLIIANVKEKIKEINNGN